MTGESEELLRNEVMPIIEEFLKERGLELSAEKTLITHINVGFDFLGCNVKKYSEKLLIKPSKTNLKAMLAKVRKFIKEHPTIEQDVLIHRLNPIIRGWVNYQRHNVSKDTFSYVDYQIFEALWKWCVRRHPKKSKSWIKEKYFHLVGTRKWTFSYKAGIKDNGGYRYKQLFYAGDSAIIRHVKIKAVVNPFSAEWQEYLEERETQLMRKSLKGRATLTRVFKEQNGLCFICNQRLSTESGFVIHNEYHGEYYNKRMLHPSCHKMFHNNSRNEPACNKL